MKRISRTEIDSINAVIDGLKDYTAETERLMKEYETLDQSVDRSLEPNAESVELFEGVITRIQELNALIGERVDHETAMVKEMAATLELDLDRPVAEQLRELLATLDGNRRLGGRGSLSTQRKVGSNRKASRRRRR